MQHNHDWQIARKKGRYVRYQCRTCLLWDNDWHHDGKSVVSADVLLTPQDRYGSLADMNVTALRKLAKAEGFTGYSKMKREDLLSMMQGTVET